MNKTRTFSSISTTHPVNLTPATVHSRLAVAAGDLLRSVSVSPNLTRIFSATLRSLGVSRSLRKLASRVAVLAPLQEVLVRDYDVKLNMSGRVLEASQRLLVDVNRVSEDMAAC